MGVHKDRKTNKWYIRFHYNGRDFEKYFGPTTQDKHLAEVALLEAKKEIRLAKLAGQGWDGFSKLKKAQRQKTFAECAEEYLDERSNFKASSLNAYRYILSSQLLPAFGKMSTKDISETTIRKFMANLTKHGMSPSRVNTVVQLLRSILGQAFRKGEIERDPAMAVKRLQEPKTRIDPFSDEELTLALSCVKEHYRPFFLCQAYTGARPNELQALRWSDIDWANEQIRIDKGRVRGHEGKPKTRSGERLIPMCAPVAESLKVMRTGKVVAIDDYVFTNLKGKPIDKHMDEIWKRALKKAGLRHRPSYQLRHTFVTRCIIKGFPLPYIAKVIGHSTIDTLIRHYAGWIDSATKEQESRLKESFSTLLTSAQHSPSTVGSKVGSSN